MEADTVSRIYLSTAEWNELLGIDDSYKAPEALWSILRDRERRDELFKETLKRHDFAVDYDWFHEYFQDEHADRANKKQDFTPNCVSTLLVRLAGDAKEGDAYYEPCAGTGGITITKWNEDRLATSFFDYRPSMFLYQVEELSDRAFPFLLFNLAIRGMNASVVQVDVLTRKGAKGAWLVQNTDDNMLGFSDIHLFPYNEATAEYFSVEWAKEETHRHEPIDPIGGFPDHLGGQAFLNAARRSAADIIETCGGCGAVFGDNAEPFDCLPDYGDVCQPCSEDGSVL